MATDSKVTLPMPKPDGEPQPDMVVMRSTESAQTVQFFPGQAVNWPKRNGAGIDGDRLENSMVETIGVEDGNPVAVIRSLTNGQTAKLVGLAGGVVVFYGPMPKQVLTKVKDAGGNDVEVEMYPVPEGCVRKGSDIISKQLVK